MGTGRLDAQLPTVAAADCGEAIQYPKFTVRGRHIVDTWVLSAILRRLFKRARELRSGEYRPPFWRFRKRPRILRRQRISQANLEDPEAFQDLRSAERPRETRH